MRAQDVMTRPVVTATPDTKLLEIVGLMIDNGISAVPIVTAKGQLVGMVSEGDLMRRSEIGFEDRSSWWLAAIGGKVRLADQFIKSHGMKAEEVMTRNVITVSPETQLPKIAEKLERNRIKRVPVVRGAAVVGIVQPS